MREWSDPGADRRGVYASGLLWRLAQGDEGVDGGRENIRQVGRSQSLLFQIRLIDDTEPGEVDRLEGSGRLRLENDP